MGDEERAVKAGAPTNAVPKSRFWFGWGFLWGCFATPLGAAFVGLLLGGGSLAWAAVAPLAGLGGLCGLAGYLSRRWRATDRNIVVAGAGFAFAIPTTVVGFALYVLTNEHGLRL